MKKIFLSAIIFLFLTSESIGIGAWSTLPGNPGTGRELSVSFNINGLVYYGTGRSPSFFGGYDYYEDFWVFDPATNVWTQKANYGYGPIAGSFSFAIGNTGYVGCGFDMYTQVTTQFYNYNPTTNIWTSIGATGIPYLDMSTAFVLNDQAYIAGGGSQFGGSASFLRYDPITSVFTTLPDIGGTGHPNSVFLKRYCATGMALNGKCYVGTGYNYLDQGMNDWWEYDPATMQWTQKNNFPGLARGGASAFVLTGNQGFVGFGTNVIPLNTFSDLWLYNPVTDTWTADVSGTPVANASVTAIGSTAYLCGGYSGSVYMNTFKKFTSCPGPGPTTITAGGPTTFCDGGTVTLTANSSTPFGTLAYAWYKDGIAIPGATGVSYVVNSYGNYSVKATNQCSSLMSANLLVNVITTGPVTISTNATSLCNGQSVTLTASTQTGSPTYQWYQYFISNPVLFNGTSATYSPMTGGDYFVSVTTACSTVYSNTINIYSTPQITVSVDPPGPVYNCTGTYPTLTGYTFGGTGAPLNYLWQLNGNPIFPLVTTPTIVPFYDGSYQYVVTDGCMTYFSIPVVVTSNTLPTVSISRVLPNTPLCTGGSDLMVSSITGPPVTYQWKKDGINIPGATTYSYAATQSGSYTLVVSNNCGSVTSNAIVQTLLTYPTASISASGPTNLCTGGNVVLSSSVTGSLPLTYQWQRDSANIAGSNIPNYTAATAGIYRLRLYNSCGSVFSNSIAVTTNLSPAVTVAASGPINFCTGGNVVLTATANGTGNTYQWLKNGVNISGATLASYTVTTSGSYVVRATNSCGNAISSATSVTVALTPTVSISTSSSLICSGASVLLTATATQTPVTYQWKLNGANIAGATSITYSANSIGNYSVVVTNACANANSNTLTLTAGTTPTATISTSGATSFCSGGSAVLNSSVTGTPVTYQWKRNGTNISGATSANYTATLAGSYTLQATNNCGNVISNSITITLLTATPATPGTITGPSSFCDYQTGVAYSIAPVANATSYNWTLPLNAIVATGQGTTSITVNFGNKNGKVKVQAINTCGSSSFQQKNVTSSNCVARPTSVTSTGEIVSVFPSPTDDELHIAINSEGSHRYNLTMMNITGKVVMNDSGNLLQDENELTVDVSSFVPGIYFLTVDLDGERVVKKVVVE